MKSRWVTPQCTSSLKKGCQLLIQNTGEFVRGLFNHLMSTDRLVRLRAPVFSFDRVTVSCFYALNDTQTIAFFTKPRESEPLPETGFGVLGVVLRLALGTSTVKDI